VAIAQHHVSHLDHHGGGESQIPRDGLSLSTHTISSDTQAQNAYPVASGITNMPVTLCGPKKPSLIQQYQMDSQSNRAAKIAGTAIIQGTTIPAKSNINRTFT